MVKSVNPAKAPQLQKSFDDAFAFIERVANDEMFRDSLPDRGRVTFSPDDPHSGTKAQDSAPIIYYDPSQGNVVVSGGTQE